MEPEMEMTRDELNKMTKRALLIHVDQHGKKPNHQSILIGNLINLIIKGGFNKPPPKREESESSEEEDEMRGECLGSVEISSKRSEAVEAGKRLEFINNEKNKVIEEIEADRKGKRLDSKQSQLQFKQMATYIIYKDMMEQSTQTTNINERSKKKKGRPKGTALYTQEEAKERARQRARLNYSLNVEKERERRRL